jgi:hypothetical protein
MNMPASAKIPRQTDTLIVVGELRVEDLRGRVVHACDASVDSEDSEPSDAHYSLERTVEIVTLHSEFLILGDYKPYSSDKEQQLVEVVRVQSRQGLKVA